LKGEVVNQEFNYLEFKNGINRTLDDTACATISAGTLAAFGRRDWPNIRTVIEKWQQEGILRVLRDPEVSNPEEPCVEMYRFIERASSIPGFLNYPS